MFDNALNKAVLAMTSSLAAPLAAIAQRLESIDATLRKVHALMDASREPAEVAQPPQRTRRGR